MQAGQFDEQSGYERSGDTLNAEYFLDGSSTAKHSQSNVVDNAIAGVRLTLKGVTSAPASITVGEPAIDTSAITAKAQAFVSAYNAVVTAARADLTEKSVPTATTSFDAGKGSLFGDTGLLGMLSSLRIQMGEQAGRPDRGRRPRPTSASRCRRRPGTSTQEAKDGKLAFDSAKFAEAMTADSNKVKDLFAAFSTGLDTFIKTQTGTSGVLDLRSKSADTEIKRIDEQVARAEDRITAKEKRLKAQFAAMEAAMSQSQTQGAWLDGQISAMNNNR